MGTRRQTTWRMGFALVAAVAALLSGGPVGAQYAEVYDLTELSGVGIENVDMWGVGDSGLVAGQICPGDGGEYACVWDRVNGYRYLGRDLFGESATSIALFVNASDEVLGYFTPEGGEQQLFIWHEDTGVRVYSPFPGTRCNVRAFADNGQIAGSYGDALSFAYVWDFVNPPVPLGHMGGPIGYSEAYGMNDAGQVVGHAQAADGTDRGFVWDAVNGMREFTFEGGRSAWAYAINNAGQIVGVPRSPVYDIGLLLVPFLWDEVDGEAYLDPLSPLCTTDAKDVNDLGHVVGCSSAERAFLWHRNHGNVDLNELVDPASDWTLVQADEITNSGLVLGRGSREGDSWIKKRFFLMDLGPDYRILRMTVREGGTTDPEPGPNRYDAGEVVTITATPDPGWTFRRWEGDAAGTTNPLTVTLDTHKAITAVFSCTYTLTTSVEGQGTINPAPGVYEHLAGTVVPVTATPEPGWVFDHWEGALSGCANPAEVGIAGDESLTAVFVPTPPPGTQCTLTSLVDGMGAVDPAGSTTYGAGTPVTIIATADPGWRFDHWEGDACGNQNPITLKLNSDRIVTAVFVAGAGSPRVFVDRFNDSGIEDGGSWATAFTKIQRGLTVAHNTGLSEVWVRAGWYDGLRPRRGDGAIRMWEGVDLYGGFAGCETSLEQRDVARNGTTIDGAIARAPGYPAYHVLIGANDARLDGFTVTGGFTDSTISGGPRGAGMCNLDLTTTIANCTFAGNHIPGLLWCPYPQNYAQGGGIYSENCTLELLDCRFWDNGGGSLYCVDGEMVLRRCLFPGNPPGRHGTAITSAGENGKAGIELYGCQFDGESPLALGSQINDVFYGNGSFRLRRCVFRGLNWVQQGAILNTHDPTVIDMADCVFERNNGSVLGGRHSPSSVIENCQFRDCVSNWCLISHWHGTMRNCVFERHTGRWLMSCAGPGEPLVENCTFSENRSGCFVLGVGEHYSDTTPIEVKNCVFDNNEVTGYKIFTRNDGSLFTYSGVLSSREAARFSLTNCLFSGNRFDLRPDVAGGATLHCYLGGTINATNCTFADNAGSSAGLLLTMRGDDADPACTASFRNCIAWNNTLEDGTPSSIVNWDGADIAVSYTDIQGGYPGDENIDVDPVFLGMGDHPYSLQEVSPCIDAGTPDGAPDRDILGTPRPLNDGYDMGAYEVLSTDADGDGILCCKEGPGDLDGDGIANSLDDDVDGDGVLDTDEWRGDPNWDDFDGDGILNFLDLDADGDGILDADECALGGWLNDVDRDGVGNFLDLDSDNDGLLDADEGNVDTDGDGIPDYLDSDSDNDGVDDWTETQLGYDPYDKDDTPDMPVEPGPVALGLIVAGVVMLLGLRLKRTRR